MPWHWFGHGDEFPFIHFIQNAFLNRKFVELLDGKQGFGCHITLSNLRFGAL
jgi:hypothetical protein